MAVTADYRAFRVSSKLGKLTGCVTANLPNPVSRCSHNITVNPDVCLLAPQRERLGIIPKGDANILDNPVDLRFKTRNCVIIQKIKKRQSSINLRADLMSHLLRSGSRASASSGHWCRQGSLPFSISITYRSLIFHKPHGGIYPHATWREILKLAGVQTIDNLFCKITNGWCDHIDDFGLVVIKS